MSDHRDGVEQERDELKAALAAATARHQESMESLRRRCAEAGSGAVRHYQQTTDQCRAEVREAVLAVPLEEG